MRYHIGVKVRLDSTDGRPLLGEGRAELLELIEDRGSLSEAAREMGMSYRYAWGMVRQISEALANPVVESVRGGRKGGRTVLTASGRRLLDAYRNAEEALQEEVRRGAVLHPRLTVDAVVARGDQVLLVRRGGPPFHNAWALPGGFVERGETLEAAVLRELREETGLEGRVAGLVGAYSRPDRDPRGHTVSVAYAVEPSAGKVRASDDAAEARWHPLDGLPDLAFDHGEIVGDFRRRGHLTISKDG